MAYLGKDPTVSVVVPYYNNAQTIDRAIHSILEQSFADFEVLIVDDCSQDQLPETIRDIAPDQIFLSRHATNRGAAAARNSGIKSSRGKYVAFLDADDSWRPGKLACQIEFLSNSAPDVKACVSGFAIHRQNARRAELHDQKVEKPLASQLLWGCPFSPGSTMICERTCFESIGLYREDLRRLEDWEWLLRYSSYYELANLAGIWADIHVSTKSPRRHIDDVYGAVQLMREVHFKTVARMGLTSSLIFRSSLELEKAAANYRSGKTWAALLISLRSLLIWPFRSGEYLSRLLKRLG